MVFISLEQKEKARSQSSSVFAVCQHVFDCIYHSPVDLAVCDH